ncbi:molybdopterin-synthase adenylyltransferase MoeB [Pelagicoccus sp. SDUM812002]|uniref:molybdopterin-synthase adenylyltransferase MoeB n=1 Tax=Pelagicoccus sp. SDUM812002 TaxID=3041266 RepID=UPI00280E5A71|nr:molybdopterin-synthase adenylyltransferase MoeB [Pelagicoccus sp. SDUM812002]MDQ8184438.1 molybdopterin-synthase adenylyltransferase MoeB [Pelagicoccus sp. SDUM812002]
MSVTDTSTLSPAELARYSRHILLDEIGVGGQEKLKQAKVLIIGAGGLGSPVALYLAAAGIGTIGLADFDKVELHNLQRQIIHGQSDIDRPKIESAKDTLSEINPHVKLQFHAEGLQTHNAVELFSQYDIIVDGTDNFATRYLNNDAAYFAGKPLVYGSIFKFEGQASFFHPKDGGPCYRCLFPEPPPPGSVPNCGEAGVMGALCGIVGSIQSMETIKHITGIGKNLSGKLLFIDTLNMGFKTLKLKKDPGCPLCGDNPKYISVVAENYQETCETKIQSQAVTNEEYNMSESPIEIDVIETKERLAGGESILVDVREKFERDICTIDGSVHIPMGEVPERMNELPNDKEILVHCHHGGRSLRVVEFLRQNGFQRVINVGGGIDSWSTQIDNSLQRY